MTVEKDTLREAVARHIGKSGWVRPVSGDNDRAWQIMLSEADSLIEVIQPYVDATPEDGLRKALEKAGFEPQDNVCASCGHSGGRHDLGNWCLECPRPEMPARPFEARLTAGWCYFSSMTDEEKWEHSVANLRVTLATP